MIDAGKCPESQMPNTKLPSKIIQEPFFDWRDEKKKIPLRAKIDSILFWSGRWLKSLFYSISRLWIRREFFFLSLFGSSCIYKGWFGSITVEESEEYLCQKQAGVKINLSHFHLNGSVLLGVFLTHCSNADKRTMQIYMCCYICVKIEKSPIISDPSLRKGLDLSFLLPP